MTRAAARLRSLALFLSLLALALAPRALAQAVPASTEPIVLVSETSCTPERYDVSALWKALLVELGELGVLAQRAPADESAATEAARTSLALIAIGCAQTPQGLWLRVSDTASGKELSRTLETADISPASQPRALALAVVALLESSWSEVVSEDARAQQQSALPESVQAIVRARLSRKLSVPRPETAIPAAPAAPRETRSQPFELTLTLRGFPGRNTGLLGLQFGVLPAPTAALRLVLTAEALWGRSDLADTSGDRVGAIQLYWLTAGGGLSWHEGSQIEIEAGPRVLIGYGVASADASSEAATAKNGSGLVLTALLTTSVRAPLGSLRLITGVDIGYTLVGVVFLGDQARLSGMADVTFALHNGFCW